MLADGSVDCDVCGQYRIGLAHYDEVLAGDMDNPTWNLSNVQRAALSHRIRTKTAERSKNDSDVFIITPDVLNSIPPIGGLPSPADRAANIVRFVGDSVSNSGKAIRRLPTHFHASIGAPNRQSAVRLIRELEEHGTMRFAGDSTFLQFEPTGIDLSLDGWKQYESQKRGSFEGDYGFIAMQFGDDDLESFVDEIVKPVVQTATGYELVDMRDVATAGIIDNIMRMRIREARFVVADLTHGNHGAYWEAGYAEGLGKQVIYICKRAKFDSEGTHFDTNHCTTVLWSRDYDEGFRQQLTATLRRSLELGA